MVSVIILRFLLWPVIACIEASDELNAGPSRELSALTLALLVAATFVLAVLLYRVVWPWQHLLLAYAALYVMLAAVQALINKYA